MVRRATLDAHPELAAAIGKLGGAISLEAIRRANYAVDGQHRNPSAVVKELRGS